MTEPAWPSVDVTIEVELRAFRSDREGDVRVVTVPAFERFTEKTPITQLELVYKYGQNDVAPCGKRSVSVGDVIRLHGKRMLVAAVWFEEVV